MPMVDILSSIASHPLLLAGFVCLCLTAVLMIPLYFQARKPRRGTIEWIGRMEPTRFHPLKQYEISFVDCIWGLLCGLGVGILQFSYAFFTMQAHAAKPGVEFLRFVLDHSLPTIAFAGGLAFVLYIAQRLLFGDIMSAVLIGVTGGVLLPMEESPVAALPLLAALVCLHCWMATAYDVSLFPRGVFLPAALGFLAWAMVSCPAAVWLLPFFLLAYVVTQFFRWKNGVALFRRRKLLFSLLLLIPSLLFALLVFTFAYAGREGWIAGSGMAFLTAPGFWDSMPKDFVHQFLATIQLFRFRLTLAELLCTLLGLCSLIPTVYGLFALKNSRCLFLLLLLPFALAAYLVSGAYLPLAVLWMVMLGWTLSTCCRRGCGAYGIICTLLTCVFYFVENIMY